MVKAFYKLEVEDKKITQLNFNNIKASMFIVLNVMLIKPDFLLMLKILLL